MSTTTESAPPVTPPAPRRAAIGGVGRTLSGYATSNPVAVILAVVVLATSIITGTIVGPATTGGDSLIWAASEVAVNQLWWWTPVTSLFIPEDPVQLVVSLVPILTLFAVAERLLGSLRAAGAFLAAGVVGIIVGLALQNVLAGMGEFWATGSELSFTLDPTVGVLGALITASALTSTLWRRRIRLVTLGLLVMFVLYNGDQSNLYRLLAALIGIGLGAILHRSVGAHRWRSSYRETRNLLALVVGISAIGPIASVLPPGGAGPLSLVGTAFTQQFPDDPEAVLAACDAHLTAGCDRQLALISAAGPGPILLSFIPLVLLIVAALGLRRGRRFAWYLALATNAVIALLTAGALGADSIVSNLRFLRGAGFLYEFVIWTLVAVVVPVLIIIMLAVSRRYFLVTAPIRALRTFWIIIAVTGLALGILYFVVALVNAKDFVPDANTGLVAIDTLRRFIPPGLDGLLGGIIVPESSALLFAYQWLGPAFWVITIAALFWLFAAYQGDRTRDEEAAYRRLLTRHSDGFGFMGT